MKKTTPKTKQSAILKYLGIQLPALKQWREENLVKGEDWWKEGVPIFWTPEAAERAIQHFTGGKQEEPEPKQSASVILESSELLTLNVIQLARNPRFVYANLNGKKVPVRCEKKRQRKLLKKPIQVEVKSEGGETTYTHRP